MRNFYYSICLIALIINLSLLSSCTSQEKTKTVGVVMPIEHNAMNEIVAGLKLSYTQANGPHVKFKIANAQGDLNLERAILQKMKNDHTDVIVTIGTDATQMAMAINKQQPIIGLAADYSETERKQSKFCNLALVHDEITSEMLLNFIHTTYPDIKQLVLVHSASDKVFPEVQDTILTGKKFGITIKPLMIQQTNDLYSVAHTIPSNTQGIFVLKDSIIVNGITVLASIAEKRHIPLITSDQGSVEGGAGVALGVHESDIGKQGAELLTPILNGKAACSLPIVEMTALTVFVNQSALQKENQSIENIKMTANKFNYPIEFVTTK